MSDDTNNESDIPQPDAEDAEDPVLRDAGARLRADASGLDAADIEVRALRRRSRQRGILAGVAAVVAVVAVVGATVIGSGGENRQLIAGGGGGPEVDRIVGSLDPTPIDPTKVRLDATVKTFPGCDALIDDLRRVGAEHVGSRGFGAGAGNFERVGAAVADDGTASATAEASNSASASGADSGQTLGTNVQVTGVDELDRVKADGKWIYDLDGHGNLRTTDATSLAIASTLRIAPDPSDTRNGSGVPGSSESLTSLLETDGHVAVFGSRSVLSEPVAGDPSATQAFTGYLTITFVDATDPTNPRITDAVQVEGSLVSARLVGGQIRLVTTSNMADIGFVLPTTPTSVAKALDRNRRSVAGSSVADWIPDWQREGDEPQPLVPCDRVHVPATFAGVAMTSLVSFPIGDGRFVPKATSIVAPGDTLYAGLDDVAISSHVWVDPIDQQRLDFDDWQTAVHEFAFADEAAPTYTGSGIVDGSTVGQFAFGEIGESLGVVTTTGTPWNQNIDNGVDLNVLTPDGQGGLSASSKVEDLAGGRGAVSAVRFLTDRVLVSTGVEGKSVRVVDVSDPQAPRRAGSITLAGPTGYFHPLPDDQVLLVGSRGDHVPSSDGPITRRWVTARLLDVSDADDPGVVGTWETPWAGDEVGSDHHAFTFWPERNLAMWGVHSTRFNEEKDPNHAVVVSVDGGVDEEAFPEAAKSPKVDAPCPQITLEDPDARQMVGKDGIVLGCGEGSKKTIEWPRYDCVMVSADMVQQYAPGRADEGTVFVCHPAPEPTVSRVLVVNGRPILMTDQTLEALDPDSFASVQVAYHPTAVRFYGPIHY